MMTETREKILRDLNDARHRLADAQRRLMELMMHRVILERLGRDTSASERSHDELERELSQLRADLEFAGHREIFTRPRATRSVFGMASNTN
jgi:predicted  nucleic acid-binding Zn-ribbon protein